MDSYEIFRQATVELEKGSKETAFELFLKAAQLGEAAAQHNVGYLYDEGVGIGKDLQKALYWYKKAWRNSRQTDTCMNIAQLYASLENNRRVIYWLSVAVDRGDGDAALDLAKFYLNRDRKGDKEKAIELLKRVGKTTHVTEAAIEESWMILLSICPERKIITEEKAGQKDRQQ